jgi:hypothetical protein
VPDLALPENWADPRLGNFLVELAAAEMDDQFPFEK